MDLFREHYREFLASRPNRYTLSLKLEVLPIVMGRGCKEFPPFKRGDTTFLPCLEVGGQKVSDPRFSHFVATGGNGSWWEQFFFLARTCRCEQ